MNRKINNRSSDSHERTLWIRYIVPILQALGNQTGLVDFPWCEVQLERHKLVTTLFTGSGVR